MEENKNTKHFMKGALCGALTMFVVVLVVAGALKLTGKGTARDADLAAITEEKLEDLKMLIDAKYLYTDEVEDEELEDGIYKGYVNALGDPYSTYYNAEEAIEFGLATDIFTNDR